MTGRWVLARAEAGQIPDPAALADVPLNWIPARVPGTVAQALLAAGLWDFDRPQNFDESDWWYRSEFNRPAGDPSDRHRLRLSGLATLADVWLNGEPILRAENMFREFVVDVTPKLRDSNELILCFRSLASALAQRRPRPRWKTKLVSHQQLRWFRTTLLGRIPGWSPPVAPVGPWRAIVLEAAGAALDVDLRASLDDRTGLVHIEFRVPDTQASAVSAELSVGETTVPLRVEQQAGESIVSGVARVQKPELWWPHTHGDARLYSCQVRVSRGGKTIEQDLGKVGFRRIETDATPGGFGLNINGAPVFCRGACWTTPDIVTLDDPPAARAALERLRDAGANMVRIGGTMVYEQDEFYRACDELGLLIWQDFMFANMDYPDQDAEFRGSVEAEATGQLRRFRRHPSVGVLCGNSEVEQQAAMLGMPHEIWRSALFSQVLPDLCARWLPGTPYVPSTPSGGALPFHVGAGVTHYYGVGAYRRPVSEVRRADVRFTPECLGFSNVPDDEVVSLAMRGDAPATHDPRWKQRVPRDTGAGWDFEDIRDHYVRDLFGVDPDRLRSSDAGRYLELGRVATGEIMARVFAEWRSAHSRCRGGLVWFLQDLWPGAGWGILDSRGRPKACWYYLRRAWQPQAVVLTDEGLDGLHLHVINETDRVLAGTLELQLLRDGRTVTAHATVSCAVDPRGTTMVNADAMLGRFHDVTYAYRFGPPTHDVVVATLREGDGCVISEDFWFPDFRMAATTQSAVVRTRAVMTDAGHYDLAVCSDRVLCAAHVDAPGFLPDDSYFCVAPGREKTVRLRPMAGTKPGFSGELTALNLRQSVPIEVQL